MKFIKQTRNSPYKNGKPYTETEITEKEALKHVSKENLETMKANVRRYPGVGELIEINADIYIGVRAD